MAKPRILNVDDTDAGRYAISRVLRGAGFEVMEAATGEEALKLAAQGPDLILLDVNLPDLDGFEVCRRVKADPKTTAIPVVHLSATYVHAKHQVQGMEGGADGYLTHPVEPQVLVATLRAFLRMRSIEAELRESEDRYRDLVENSHEMICTHDLSGRLLSVNSAAASLTGYTREALLGMNLADLLTRGANVRFADYLAELATTGEAQGLMHIRTANGRTRWLEYRNTLHTEGVPVVRGVARDVTQRRQAELGLAHRDAVMAAVAWAAQQCMLPDQSWRQAIPAILAKIGAAADVSRVYLFETLRGAGASLVSRQTHEWVAPGVKSFIDDPALQEFCWADHGAASLAAILDQGNPVFHHRRELPEAFARVLAEEDIESIALVPVMVEGRCRGFVGFDQCHAERQWAAPEREALVLVASTLAAAIRQEAARQVLRDSEERFRATFEQAAVGIAHVAPDGHWLRVNQTLCDIVGYTREELLARAFQDITHPDDLGPDLEQVQKLLAGTISNYSLAKRYIRKNGELVWIELTVALVRRTSGAPDYFISVVEDISARKRSEELLRDSELRNRTVLQSAMDGFMLIDSQGKLLEVSDAFAQLLGYAPEELLTMNLADIEAVETPEQTARHVQAVLERGSDRFETRHRRKDGAVLDVEISVHATRASGKDVFFAFLRDITERKRQLNIAQARARLLEFATKHTGVAVLQEILDVICELVDSPIGFYHFVEADQDSLSLQAWSTRTLAEYCHVEENFDRHYPVARAGAWADCLRVGKPVIHNDFAALPNRKGLPVGHAAVVRELAVPIFRKGLAVAILGVGNKPRHYDQADVEMVTYFAELAWDIAEREQAERQLARLTQLYALLYNVNETIVRAQSEQELFERICTIALEHGKLFGAIVRLDEDGSGVLRAAAYTESVRALGEKQLVCNQPAHPDYRMCMPVAYREGRLIVDNEIASSRPYSSTDTARALGIHSRAALPLKRDGKPVGAIVLFALEPQFFDEAMCRLLEQMAMDISFALDTLAGGRERQRAQQALKESEERFRGLVEQSLVGIFIIDAEKILYCNPRSAEIFDYAVEELEHMSVRTLVVPDDFPTAESELRRVLTGEAEIGRIEVRTRRRDGSEITIGAQGLRTLYKGQPAVLGVMQDITEKKLADAQIRRYVAQLEAAFMSTVGVATTLSEMRDPYTVGHERRVAEIAVAIGAEMGMDNHQQEGLRVAGHLHDVGKMMVPAEILSKPGKLNPIEYQLIQGHSQSSYEVLKDVQFPWPVAQIALQHHERMDGSGYPQGLKGDEILLEARIMAVADVIEAMSSHRPYRPGLGIDKALAEIERGRGTLYDPGAADACLTLFREKGFRIPE